MFHYIYIYIHFFFKFLFLYWLLLIFDTPMFIFLVNSHRYTRWHQLIDTDIQPAYVKPSFYFRFNVFVVLWILWSAFVRSSACHISKQSKYKYGKLVGVCHDCILGSLNLMFHDLKCWSLEFFRSFITMLLLEMSYQNEIDIFESTT